MSQQMHPVIDTRDDGEGNLFVRWSTCGSELATVMEDHLRLASTCRVHFLSYNEVITRSSTVICIDSEERFIAFTEDSETQEVMITGFVRVRSPGSSEWTEHSIGRQDAHTVSGTTDTSSVRTSAASGASVSQPHTENICSMM